MRIEFVGAQVLRSKIRGGLFGIVCSFSVG